MKAFKDLSLVSKGDRKVRGTLERGSLTHAPRRCRGALTGSALCRLACVGSLRCAGFRALAF